MNADERREMVEAVLFCAQKSRSNALEAVGDDSVGQEILLHLNPTLFRDDALNLVTVCMHVLEGGREVTESDLYNVLYLANQDPLVGLAYVFRCGGELPEPAAALA